MRHPNGLLFFLSFMMVSCQSSELKKDYPSIQGNWFYFNLDYDSLESYSETYIDSSHIIYQTYIMGISPVYQYEISNDSVFYLDNDDSKRPAAIIKRIFEDTLVFTELSLSGHPHQDLLMVRIDEDNNFNPKINSSTDNWQEGESRQRADFYVRAYRQYLNEGFLEKNKYDQLMKDTIQIFFN